jgi:protein-S-isoprenylcysteine O-methyltransferase Ste14
MESLFRATFWIIFGGMIVIQAYFTFRARQAGTRKAIKCEKMERDEGWKHTVVRASRAITLVVFLVLYAINSPWLEVLSVPLPEWLRWMGGVFGTASLAFYTWSRATLGKEWSSPLQLREHHHLVTTGPYAWVRHPIYLSLIIFMTAIALMTANWFLILFLVISIVDLVLRIPKEEQMMIDEFGDEYKAYMQRTGRLLPRGGLPSNH